MVIVIQRIGAGNPIPVSPDVGSPVQGSAGAAGLVPVANQGTDTSTGIIVSTGIVVNVNVVVRANRADRAIIKGKAIIIKAIGRNKGIRGIRRNRGIRRIGSLNALNRAFRALNRVLNRASSTV